MNSSKWDERRRKERGGKKLYDIFGNGTEGSGVLSVCSVLFISLRAHLERVSLSDSLGILCLN
jgi:hypothetical protein